MRYTQELIEIRLLIINNLHKKLQIIYIRNNISHIDVYDMMLIRCTKHVSPYWPWVFFRHGVEVPMTRDDDPMESKPSSKAG